jgi:hypothetical protein
MGNMQVSNMQVSNGKKRLGMTKPSKGRKQFRRNIDKLKPESESCNTKTSRASPAMP